VAALRPAPPQVTGAIYGCGTGQGLPFPADLFPLPWMTGAIAS
jgi:hypothetical protein